MKSVDGTVQLTMVFSFTPEDLAFKAETDEEAAEIIESYDLITLVNDAIERVLETAFSLVNNELGMGITNLYQTLDSIEYEIIEEEA